MEAPRNIRSKIIATNRAELELHGTLCTRQVQTGGRPANAYLLNEQQALLVCMFSRTGRASAIRKEVIEVFTAHRRGQLQPAQTGRLGMHGGLPERPANSSDPFGDISS